MRYLRLPVRAAAGALAATALLAAGAVLAAAGPPASVRVLTASEEVPVPATEVALGCPGPPSAASTSSQLEGDSGAVAPATAVRALTVLPERTAPALGLPRPPAPVEAPSVGDPEDPSEPALRLFDPEAGGEPVVGSPLPEVGGAIASAAGGGPRTASASPVLGVEPLLAGASTASATSGDLRGLSAPPCVAVADEAWLVGGATEVGDSTRLVVLNPGDAPATVRADAVVDPGAAVDGGTLVPLPQMSLAAGQQRSVLLEGVAPGAASLAVRVRSDGADVAAWLVTTSLRGLVPRGTDVVTAGAGPSREQVVPGVVAADGEGTPVLRLATTGPSPVVARWQVVGPDGPLTTDGLRLAATVPAAGAVDVPLDGLPPGTWTVRVVADAPVVAGAQRSTAGDDGVAADLSWTGSARPLSGQVVLAVPPQPETGGDGTAESGTAGGADGAARVMVTRLVLHAGPEGPGAGASPVGPASAAVAVVGADGALGPVSEVTLPPSSTRVLEVDGLPRAGDGGGSPVAVLVAVDGRSPVVAALETSLPSDDEGARGGSLVSAHAVAPAPVSSAAVRVELRGSP